MSGHPELWLLSAILWLFLCWAKRSPAFFMILIFLPSTALHESAHYVVSLILGCRPSFPSIIPHRLENSWQLGAVRAEIGWFSALPVALAPLFLIPIILLVARLVHLPTLTETLLLPFAAHASLPSPTDLKVGFLDYPAGALFWTALVAIAFALVSTT